jgi:hypothetical protein
MKNFYALSITALVLTVVAQPSFAQDRSKGRYTTTEAVAENGKDVISFGGASAIIRAANPLALEPLVSKTVVAKDLAPGALTSSEVQKILTAAKEYDTIIGYNDVGGANVEVTLKDGAKSEIRVLNLQQAGDDGLKSQLEALSKEGLKVEKVRMIGIGGKAIRGLVNGAALLSAGAAAERVGAMGYSYFSTTEDYCGRVLCQKPSAVKSLLNAAEQPAYRADVKLYGAEAISAEAAQSAAIDAQ